MHAASFRHSCQLAVRRLTQRLLLHVKGRRRAASGPEQHKGEWHPCIGLAQHLYPKPYNLDPEPYSFESWHPCCRPTDICMPVQAYPTKNDPSVCNQNLPNDSVYHRFLYVLQVGFDWSDQKNYKKSKL